MKRGVFFLLLIVLINSSTAYYNCSNGSIIEETKVVLRDGKTKTINVINIDLIGSSVTTIEFLIDTEKVRLSNTSPSKQVGLGSGVYNISLISINVSENSVRIKVKSSTEKFNKGEIKKVSDLRIYVYDFQGPYPGQNFYVNLTAAIDDVILSSKNQTFKKVINGSEYLFNASSPDRDGATIKVMKCLNGKITLINDSKVQLVIPATNYSSNESVNDNSSNISLDNKSTSQISPNVSAKGNNNVLTNFLNPKNVFEKIKKKLIYILPIIIIVVGFIIFFIYKNSKRQKEELNSLLAAKKSLEKNI